MSPKHFSDNHVHLMYVDSNGMRDLVRESDLRTLAKLADPSKRSGHTHMSLYFIGLRHTCFLSYVACHMSCTQYRCTAYRPDIVVAQGVSEHLRIDAISTLFYEGTLKIQRWIQSTSRSAFQFFYHAQTSPRIQAGIPQEGRRREPKDH